MDTKSKIKELIGRDMGGFKIIEMTEVYRVNDDGRKVSSLGFFKDSDTAEAFAGIQTDSNWHNTGQTLVLTDGTVGYAITEEDPVHLFDDEYEVIEIKKQAIAKLSPSERRILRLE